MAERDDPLTQRWLALFDGSLVDLLTQTVHDLASCADGERARLARTFSALVCGPRAPAGLAQRLSGMLEGKLTIPYASPAQIERERGQSHRALELRERLAALSAENVAAVEAQGASIRLREGMDAMQGKLRQQLELIDAAASLLRETRP